MFKHELHQDEQLLEVYRKHELTLAPKILQIFALIFIPWFFGIKYDFIFSSALHKQIFLIWTIVVAIYALRIFLVWAVNAYLVTNQRLIQISHSGIFKKNVTETPLDRILNISFRTTGFFSTIFKYGDVLVQAVGLDGTMILESVPNPSEIKDFLWKMHMQIGGEQKLTFTSPEIAPIESKIRYAPEHLDPHTMLKKKRNV